MTSPRKVKRFATIEILLILVVSALAYLPNLAQAGYYRDDWYYMVDRLRGGPTVFPVMFSIDRPARGPLLEAYYGVFGPQPLPYHAAAYAWRLVGGLAVLWLFRRMWPGKRWIAMTGALLFTIYPGYLWWVEGVEYQPMVISAALEVVSIAMTLEAIRARWRAPRLGWLAGSILTGWAYLALVDYALGMEVFRFLCVFVVVSRGREPLSLLKKGLLALRAWAIFAIIPAAYLVWKLFFFTDIRADTSLRAQLEVFIRAPLQTGVAWIEHFIQSSLNVGLLTWGTPFYLKFPLLFGMALWQLGLALLLAAGAVACVILADAWLRKAPPPDEAPVSAAVEPPSTPPQAAADRWQAEAVWIGVLGVLAGVIPVIIANRYIIFDYYSHYTLPGSLAAVALATGLLGYLSNRRARVAVTCVLAATAVLTHYAVSSNAVQEEQIVNQFWWQVTWRAPSGIQSGTTLLAYYPGVDYGEDSDIVVGPANLIYYPQKVTKLPVLYPLSVLNMTFYMPHDVLAGGPIVTKDYRTHVMNINYGQILAMSQPTAGACVHVFDGRWPRYSDNENERMLLVGQTSKIQTVLPPSGTPIRPPAVPFGSEPVHGWCYYYQKAELALQQNDYAGVSALASQAASMNLSPADPVEWMPFIQAFAALGDQADLARAAAHITPTPTLKQEACKTLQTMQSLGTSITQQAQDLFCK
jgi:hypothetical protein